MADKELITACYPGQEHLYINMLKEYNLEGKVTFMAEELPNGKIRSAVYGGSLPWIGIYACGIPEEEKPDLILEYHFMCSGYSICLHDLKLQPYQA